MVDLQGQLSQIDGELAQQTTNSSLKDIIMFLMDIILKKVRIKDEKDLKDIAIKDGKIAAIENNIEGSAAREIDAEGRDLIPGLIESHIHLDKALIADRLPNKSGTFH